MDWFNKMINEAICANASNIHLTAGSRIRMRVNDELVLAKTHTEVLNPEDIMNLNSSLLNEKQLKHLKLKKSMLTTLETENGRARIAISQQRGSYYINMKLGSKIDSLASYKFCNVINEFHKFKSGLILVTGDTRSGRSTTCAQIVNNINNSMYKNIVTIESSIEYSMKHNKSILKQKEIGIDVYDYLSGLEFSLKEDADVIYLDELPDKDTLTTAIRVAEQGKLVVASLNTKDAFATVQYVLNSYEPSKYNHIKLQFANSLKAIVSQKLVKEQEKTIPIFEVLINNGAVKRLILEGKLNQLYDVIDKHANMGMVAFDAYIASLINKNIISKELGMQIGNSKRVNEYLNKGCFMYD